MSSNLCMTVENFDLLPKENKKVFNLYFVGLNLTHFTIMFLS